MVRPMGGSPRGWGDLLWRCVAGCSSLPAWIRLALNGDFPAAASARKPPWLLGNWSRHLPFGANTDSIARFLLRTPTRHFTMGSEVGLGFYGFGGGSHDPDGHHPKHLLRQSTWCAGLDGIHRVRAFRDGEHRPRDEARTLPCCSEGGRRVLESDHFGGSGVDSHVGGGSEPALPLFFCQRTRSEAPCLA